MGTVMSEEQETVAVIHTSEESAGLEQEILTSRNTAQDTAIIIYRHFCKGCEICVEVCPKDVLRMAVTPDRWEGAVVEVVDVEACNACMLCEHQCPDFAIEVYNEKKEKKAQAKKAAS
jgi:2-oxoglutarate ferredoxin oxidoreductase subunit delta